MSVKLIEIVRNRTGRAAFACLIRDPTTIKRAFVGETDQVVWVQVLNGEIANVWPEEDIVEYRDNK